MSRILSNFKYVLLFIFISNIVLSQNLKISISGKVKDQNEKGIMGAIVYLKSGNNSAAWTENKTVTDSNGNYMFSDLPSGLNHTLKVMKNNYTFRPAVGELNNVTENKILDFVVFIPVVSKYNISGYIKDINSVPVKGVAVNLTARSLYGQNSSDYLIETDETGFYKFEKLDSGGYYYITPKKERYIFKPLNKVFEVLNENKTQNFTATQLTDTKFSISGYVKDKDSRPVMGVIVYLAGSPISSRAYFKMMTDSNGFYKFEDLEAGQYYSVSVAKEGYLFNPAEKIVETLTENKILDFVAITDTTPKFSIQGYVKDKNDKGMAKVTVRLFGTLLNSISFIITTDSLGYYKFTNLRANVGYQLSPFMRGYVFSPERIVFDSLTENKTQNFIGTENPANLTVSGYVKDKDSNPIEGAIIYMGGSAGVESKIITDANGFYKVDKLEGGQSIKMFVSKFQYTFEPDHYAIENLMENKVVNFIGKKLVFYSISGKIKDQDNKSLMGVQMSLDGSTYSVARTDSSGIYKIENLPEGSRILLTPAKFGYAFEPKSFKADNINQNLIQNFTATKVSVTSCIISGYIKDKNSKGIEGVTLTLSGGKIMTMNVFNEFAPVTARTDAAGFYKFENVEPGLCYSISPNKPGYSFNPRYIIFENLNENKIRDFVGTVVTSYSISGYVKDKDQKGIGAVSITIGGEKLASIIMTDSTGYYKIDNLDSDKFYSILPSKRGFKFDPVYKKYENLDGNKTLNFLAIAVPVTRYSIIGYIEDNNNHKMSGVKVSLVGDIEYSTTTDDNGIYVFEDIEEGKNYTIIPTKDGYSFYPPSSNLYNLDNSKALNSIATNNFVTSIGGNNILPAEIKLYPNYPNPFNPVTTVEYEINKASEVKLVIFDLLGREVYTLYNGYQNAGNYKFQFNAGNFSSGKYIVRLQTGNAVKTINISLVK